MFKILFKICKKCDEKVLVKFLMMLLFYIIYLDKKENQFINQTKDDTEKILNYCMKSEKISKTVDQIKLDQIRYDRRV